MMANLFKPEIFKIDKTTGEKVKAKIKNMRSISNQRTVRNSTYTRRFRESSVSSRKPVPDSGANHGKRSGTVPCCAAGRISLFRADQQSLPDRHQIVLPMDVS
jgi:hypothetical protein